MHLGGRAVHRLSGVELGNNRDVQVLLNRGDAGCIDANGRYHRMVGGRGYGERFSVQRSGRRELFEVVESAMTASGTVSNGRVVAENCGLLHPCGRRRAQRRKRTRGYESDPRRGT